MDCAIPRTVCQMQSWKRSGDCTTSETRTISGGSKPNENLIPEKVYSSAPTGTLHPTGTSLKGINHRNLETDHAIATVFLPSQSRLALRPLGHRSARLRLPSP